MKKIAAVLKESDELVDDLPWLASAINNRGIYLVQLEEENQLLNGTGSGTDLKGILKREGILTEQTAKGESNVADAIFRAMTKVSNESPFAPDGIVINPADYQTLRLAKDANSQYYGGGFFAGQYGAGGVMENPPIWGLRTVVTPAIDAGTVLVGAFGQGASVIRRSGLTVEVANQNEDDFKYNRIAIRIEERLCATRPRSARSPWPPCPSSGRRAAWTRPPPRRGDTPWSWAASLCRPSSRPSAFPS